jgi:hypothetical protein
MNLGITGLPPGERRDAAATSDQEAGKDDIDLTGRGSAALALSSTGGWMNLGITGLPPESGGTPLPLRSIMLRRWACQRVAR